MAHPVATYLADLHHSLDVGVPETSGYPALRNLLNAVGDTLNQKIIGVLHPSNIGAGLPDGGLFPVKELRRYGDSPTLLEMKPERGIIELQALLRTSTDWSTRSAGFYPSRSTHCGDSWHCMASWTSSVWRAFDLCSFRFNYSSRA